MMQIKTTISLSSLSALPQLSLSSLPPAKYFKCDQDQVRVCSECAQIVLREETYLSIHKDLTSQDVSMK